jgi:hypothetical protein
VPLTFVKNLYRIYISLTCGDRFAGDAAAGLQAFAGELAGDAAVKTGK